MQPHDLHCVKMNHENELALEKYGTRTKAVLEPLEKHDDIMHTEHN
jgi:hypothetical protein